VTITGSLTLDKPGVGVVPFGGMALAVVETYGSTTVALGTAKTAANGTYSVIVHPTVSGQITVKLAAGAGWTAASANVGTGNTVNIPNTVLTAHLSATDVGYAATTRVYGTLMRDAGGVVTGLVGARVQVTATTNVGGVQTSKIIGTPTVGTGGVWTMNFNPLSDEELSVSFAGAAGLPAGFADAGGVTTHTWTTGVTATATTVTGPRTQVSGTVTRSYGGVTAVAPSVPVKIYSQHSGGSPVLLATVLSNASGVYVASLALVSTSDVWTAVSSVTGYSDVTSVHASYIAPTVIGVWPSARSTSMTFTVKVTVPRSVGFTVQQLVPGPSWVTIGTGTTSTLGTGTATVPVTNYPTTLYFRVLTSADGYGGAGTSAAVTVR
jgi:hypothetical protein